MRFTSNILGELSSAIKRTLVGPFETDISIPPQVLPIIAVQNVLRCINPPATDVQQTSVLAELGLVVSNAGASSQNIVQLGPGVWHVDWTATYSSNYASLGAGFDVTLTVGNLGTTDIVRLRTELVGATLTLQGAFNITLENNLNVFAATLGANGVGNTHRGHVSLLIGKLL